MGVWKVQLTQPSEQPHTSLTMYVWTADSWLILQSVQKNVIYVCISSLKCIFSNINLQRYLSCIETYRKGFLLYILCYIKSAGQKAWNIWGKRSKRECVFKLIHRKMCEYTKSEFWHPSAAPTQKTDLDVRWKGVCTWAAPTPEGTSHHSVESWGFVWAFLSAAQGLSDITNSI